MNLTSRSAPRRSLLALAATLVVLAPAAARAFALFPEYGGSSVGGTLDEAARWSSVTGLDDGLQVGVAPGVAEALQVPGDDLAAVEQAIVNGILAWQSPVLRFDILLDAPGTAEGPDTGFEIDLFAVPASHPLFVANPQAFTGLANPSSTFFGSRPLTNGQASSGYGITGADVYLNIDNFQFLAALGAGRLDVLTRVVIHEFGHALGLGHPNEFTNYDTDTDPFNAMPIDPDDPFAELLASPNFDTATIMSNQPCGPNPTSACPAVFFTTLGPDEIGGRDVLYPLPEPSTALLVAGGLLALGARRRRP
ncbi:MAG: PEP-CTERM sorting domain-containing protein [Myxococcota bacterium]